jgi:hypothetical protein
MLVSLILRDRLQPPFLRLLALHNHLLHHDLILKRQCLPIQFFLLVFQSHESGDNSIDALFATFPKGLYDFFSIGQAPAQLAGLISHVFDVGD